jgi:hypothetical protein
MTSRTLPRTLAPSCALRILTGALSLLLLTLVGVSQAVAAPYPLPTSGEGQVTRSTIFSGGGFLPGSTVMITDNGKLVGTTKADKKGNFRDQVCFGTDAALGKHTLAGTGTGANGAGRVVTAVVTVIGAEASGGSTGAGNGNGNGNGGGNGGGSRRGGGNVGGNGGGNVTAHRGAGGSKLPFNRADTRDLRLIGLALVAASSLLVRKGYQDRAKRRARTAAV